MSRQQQRRRAASARAVPLTPIALSVAIWLGLAVAIAGLSSMAVTSPPAHATQAPAAAVR